MIRKGKVTKKKKRQTIVARLTNMDPYEIIKDFWPIPYVILLLLKSLRYVLN